MTSCWGANKDNKKVKDATLMMNGAILLEKLIAFCNGKSNPIRIFSSEELKRATDNYDPHNIITCDSGYKLYRGVLRERPVSIKKFEENAAQYDYCFNDIIFASQMSVHKNFLKLLGCCLETQVPVIVFESVQDGTLADRIYGPKMILYQPLLWINRLKVAMEIADAVAFLHLAFARPIVFRNIKPLNIFLDECNVVKLADLSLAVSILEGESHVKDSMAGAWGLIVPEYATTECFNESQDVYNFGVFLLILLTGQMTVDYSRVEAGKEHSLVDHVKTYIEDDRFDDILDSEIAGDGSCSGKDQQLKYFTALSLRCISEAENDRPVMKDVAKELQKIYRSASSPS